MSEPFELHDPNAAKEYLDSFDAATRRKGEDYFRQGRVGREGARLHGIPPRA